VNECRENQYDAVLMDIDMPVMNGWDATVQIKRNKPEIPVIALTAYNEESFKEKSFSSRNGLFFGKTLQPK